MTKPVTMLTPELLNYGVLGLWTISLLYDKWVTMQKLNNTIDNNTRAIKENTLVLAQIRAKMGC